MYKLFAPVGWKDGCSPFGFKPVDRLLSSAFFEPPAQLVAQPIAEAVAHSGAQSDMADNIATAETGDQVRLC